MQSGLNICSATGTETSAIARIAQEAGLFPAEMLDDMIAGYLNRTSPDLWLVAKAGEEPVGFAFAAPEKLTDATWNLLAIAVQSDQRGSGIGANLVREVETQLSVSGGRVLFVETLGTSEYMRARNFYVALGFAEEARIRDYYEDGGDKIVYWKRL
jgi:ribosomal protein S18 acetylase RimI-like enzyme